MFSRSSLCFLGQHGTCSSAQLSVELSENMLQNLFLNLPPQTVAYKKIYDLEQFAKEWDCFHSVLPSCLLPNLIGDSLVMLPFLATAGGAMGVIAASDIDLEAFDFELDVTEDVLELLWPSSFLKWQIFQNVKEINRFRP